MAQSFGIQARQCFSRPLPALVLKPQRVRVDSRRIRICASAFSNDELSQKYSAGRLQGACGGTAWQV